MRLVYKGTEKEVQKGDILTDFRVIMLLRIIGKSLHMAKGKFQ